LLGASDDDHLQFCIQSGRVIVTHDDDFLRLAATGAAAFPRAGFSIVSSRICLPCHTPELSSHPKTFPLQLGHAFLYHPKRHSKKLRWLPDFCSMGE
jgi:hypothetical protein